MQLRSYGGNESIPEDRVGYIAVNGRVFASYTGDLTSENIAVGILNPDTCLISTNSIRLFNTGSASLPTATYEYLNLLAYLDNIYPGAIIVGINIDNAFSQSTNNAIAFNVLNAHGVFINDVAGGGKFAFVAQKGYTYKTALSKILTASPALVLSANVETLKQRTTVTASALVCISVTYDSENSHIWRNDDSNSE